MAEQQSRSATTTQRKTQALQGAKPSGLRKQKAMREHSGVSTRPNVRVSRALRNFNNKSRHPTFQMRVEMEKDVIHTTTHSAVRASCQRIHQQTGVPHEQQAVTRERAGKAEGNEQTNCNECRRRQAGVETADQATGSRHAQHNTGEQGERKDSQSPRERCSRRRRAWAAGKTRSPATCS